MYRADCGKCNTSYAMDHDPEKSIICPECHKRGDTVVGVLNFLPYEPSYEELAEKLAEVTRKLDELEANIDKSS